MKTKKTNLKNLVLVGGALLLSLLSACNKTEPEKPLTDLEAKGKAAYMSNCIACHNPNPKVAGSIGPDIAFSSLELVTLRITKAEYPAGYKPKRESHMMPALPQLAGDIPAIHAYLNSFKR